MLAIPSGTSPIIAALSGAGERIPALAHEASLPGFWLSKSPTRNPARASSSAIEPPISPPPAITASKVFMQRFYSNRNHPALNAMVARRVTARTKGLPRESPLSSQAFLRAPNRLLNSPHELPQETHLSSTQCPFERYSNSVSLRRRHYA